MTIQLRPHHLLCMLTFVGKGYSPAFVANFEQVVRRIAQADEDVQIVQGPDDLCLPYLSDAGCHCHNTSVLKRDRLAAEAISRLLQRPLHAGVSLQISRSLVPTLRAAFADGTIRQACAGCQWKPTCDGVVQSGFAESCLMPTSELSNDH
ncbi:DUF1284 domain-containing protein [Tunturiibacter lichenicola]|uniref:DUF1284 domain-containing protein n=1 Tax=Tunturiibacter lichenicola TaxID=2051959 RepID=UPI0021B2813B|nr:DUF1284 domain-containing protein [Edaphobacter lichenicola]